MFSRPRGRTIANARSDGHVHEPEGSEEGFSDWGRIALRLGPRHAPGHAQHHRARSSASNRRAGPISLTSGRAFQGAGVNVGQPGRDFHILFRWGRRYNSSRNMCKPALNREHPLYQASGIDELSLPRLKDSAVWYSPGTQEWLNDLPNKANWNSCWPRLGRSLTHSCVPGMPTAKSFSRGSESSSMLNT